MTSQKQLLANLTNAQLSTGPVTVEGKGIVASNAIKHGIFTKDLIIASGAGEESREEYEELLAGLIQCLSPRNQMESLLVEKIAVDFWRLRRTIRFESGSINKQVEQMINSCYTHGKRDNTALDKEIEHIKESIAWNAAYLKSLRKKEVSFDQPTWEGKTISSDIIDDLFLIARALPDLSRAERDWLYGGESTFEGLSTLVAQHGYKQKEQITDRLIELYSKENGKLEKELEELYQKKICNQAEDSRNAMMGFIPAEESGEKALKYERSIQKTIFQNLFLLKKLQGVF